MHLLFLEEHSNRQLWVLALFLGHASCSVFLVLVNKTISTSFPYAWTVVALQNTGTIVCSCFLHLNGKVLLRQLQRHQVLPLLVDAIWLVAVLMSSFKALEEVSLLVVVIRNTVPFLTALSERAALKKPMDAMLVVALLITFVGTILYSVTDFTIRYNGAIYAISNAVLVAGMCTYERYLMTSANLGMSAIDINFHRVVLSMPLIATLGYTEGFPATLLDLAVRRYEALLIASSAFAAFGIGTLLLALQAEVSATTIQVANVSYKCATTVVSRLTHPSELTAMGVFGYCVCTGGVLTYTLTRPPSRGKAGLLVSVRSDFLATLKFAQVCHAKEK
ncbi:GFT1 [Symbiodinium natans]|uniref:GFT1 protein n=1 Tax=Symbiodinium natans TaxID=878477 RepID=A0A812INN4_9DINO|nr:GFT1 [Symbiodinium natans]